MSFLELDKRGQYELLLYKKQQETENSENDMERMKVSKQWQFKFSVNYKGLFSQL